MCEPKYIEMKVKKFKEVYGLVVKFDPKDQIRHFEKYRVKVGCIEFKVPFPILLEMIAVYETRDVDEEAFQLKRYEEWRVRK